MTTEPATGALLAIQSVHTAIAAWNYACLFTMIVCHFKDIRPTLLKIAYVSIAIEAIAILPFKLVCPIRLIVDHYWSIYTDDILLPANIARMIMPVGIALFSISWIPVLIRKVRALFIPA